MLAKVFEDKGFAFLLNKDIDNAIKSFTQSENSYNGYNMVYDTAFHPKKSKNNLGANDHGSWKEVYATIISKYGWKIPQKYKSKFIAQSK